MRVRNPNHLSYLLRIWKDSEDGDWHATLQDVISGECFHFATLYELYVNLKEFTREDIKIQMQVPLEPFDNLNLHAG